MRLPKFAISPRGQPRSHAEAHASERHRALSALLGVAARVMTKLTALLLVLGLHLAHAKFSRKNKQFLPQVGDVLDMPTRGGLGPEYQVVSVIAPGVKSRRVYDPKSGNFTSASRRGGMQHWIKKRDFNIFDPKAGEFAFGHRVLRLSPKGVFHDMVHEGRLEVSHGQKYVADIKLKRQKPWYRKWF